MQNSNLGFGQQFENVLDSDDLYNFPDYDIDNIPTQPENEDNDDDLWYLETQAINIIGKNSKNNQAYYYFSVRDESNSDSDNLEYIDKLFSQSVPLCLISLGQNLTGSQLSFFTTSAITRTARGITLKKLINKII